MALNGKQVLSIDCEALHWTGVCRFFFLFHSFCPFLPRQSHRGWKMCALCAIRRVRVSIFQSLVSFSKQASAFRQFRESVRNDRETNPRTSPSCVVTARRPRKEDSQDRLHRRLRRYRRTLRSWQIVDRQDLAIDRRTILNTAFTAERLFAYLILCSTDDANETPLSTNCNPLA